MKETETNLANPIYTSYTLEPPIPDQATLATRCCRKLKVV